MDNVGELVGAGIPWLEGEHWVMAVVRANALSGVIGQVGTIAVSATTGEVAYSPGAIQR
jgi:hypothetical protein